MGAERRMPGPDVVKLTVEFEMLGFRILNEYESE